MGDWGREYNCNGCGKRIQNYITSPGNYREFELDSSTPHTCMRAVDYGRDSMCFCGRDIITYADGRCLNRDGKDHTCIGAVKGPMGPRPVTAVKPVEIRPAVRPTAIKPITDTRRIAAV